MKCLLSGDLLKDSRLRAACQTGLLLWALCHASLVAQAGEARNPRTSPADVAAGSKNFHLYCVNCHGPNGEGGLGPDLRTGEFQHGGSDEALRRSIRSGIPGSEMPPTSLPMDQIWQLVAYVRSLSEVKVESVVRGDRQRGERLFVEKGACDQCHSVNGRGGILGPDLSLIGSRRSPTHLRTSITDPDKEVDPQYWTVRGTDLAGKSFEGIRLGEDTFSIQFLDRSGRLRSLEKSSVRKIEIQHTSLMPSYRDMFTDADLDDLVAYLHSLQRKAGSR